MTAQLRAESLNHPHVAEERAHLFHSYDSCTTEDEYLHVIYSLVYALKPERVLETGTFNGVGSCFIARALKRNGVGHLTTIEITESMALAGREQLRRNGLLDLATVIHADSLEYLKTTEQTFDFAFFDSLLPNRCKELKICLDRGLMYSGSWFALHDTSRLRAVAVSNAEQCQPYHETEAIRLDPDTAKHWEEFEAMPEIKFLEFPYSRGLTVGQVI